MSKLRGYLLLFVYVVAVIAVSYWLGQQAYNWMPEAATAEAQDVDRLFSFLVTLGSLVFFGVAGTIGHSIIFNRADPEDFSEGHATRGSDKLEIIWIAIPTVLVLWISFSSWNVYQELSLEGLGDPMVHLPTETIVQNVFDPAAPAIEEIKVIAKQWSWSFYYPQADLTSDELHLPVNKETRLVFESKDVIHGFFVPEFRFKQDIIPNRTVDITFTPLREGKYTLHDSQFSGTYFAVMQADVYVEPQTDYDNWLKTANDNPAIKTNLAAEEYQRSRLDAVAAGSKASPVVARRRSEPSALRGNPQDRAESLFELTAEDAEDTERFECCVF